MALKLAGEKDGYKEKIEQLVYYPTVQDTGDLEAATGTITATSEASGIENADYSKALTLPKPDDARLVAKRIVARLAVTIDSFDTATHLYCRVYVDAQDADHRLFDEDWEGTGAKLDAVDIHSGAKSTIFDLLKDGSAHTFYFFFWVDQANNAVISLVQLWEGVGSCATNLDHSCLDIEHKGFLSGGVYLYGEGTGTASGRFLVNRSATNPLKTLGNGDNPIPNLLVCNTSINVGGTVATDLNAMYKVTLILRSE